MAFEMGSSEFEFFANELSIILNDGEIDDSTILLYDDFDSDYDDDEDYVDELHVDSESDDEIDAVVDPIEEGLGMVGKNGHEKEEPLEQVGRSAPRKLPFYPASAVGAVKSAKTPLEVWKYLITDDMMNLILESTNEEINRRLAKIKPKGTYVSRALQDKSTKSSYKIKPLGNFNFFPSFCFFS